MDTMEQATTSPIPAASEPVEKVKKIKKHRTDRKPKTKKRQRGFSLLELLVVVGIILVISAIALPFLIKARTAGANSGGAASLKSLNTAIAMYQSQFNATPATATVLYTTGDCIATPAIATASCMLPFNVGSAMFSAAGQNGYTFAYTPNAGGPGFSATATPVAGGSATRNYWSDGTQITYSDSGAATSASNLLGN